MKNSIQKGFTLIELLIVIAIIGVLAGVLFVAINPSEQNNKAKDSAIAAMLNQIPKQAVLSNLKTFRSVCQLGSTDTTRSLTLYGGGYSSNNPKIQKIFTKISKILNPNSNNRFHCEYVNRTGGYKIIIIGFNKVFCLDSGGLKLESKTNVDMSRQIYQYRNSLCQI